MIFASSESSSQRKRFQPFQAFPFFSPTPSALPEPSKLFFFFSLYYTTLFPRNVE
jgi:hypothetical protein